MASQTLRGRKVAILLAPAGTEQIEFTEPKKAVEDAGADVDAIGAQAGSARTYNHDLDPGDTSPSTRPSARPPPTTTTPCSCRAASWARTSFAVRPPRCAWSAASSRPTRPAGRHPPRPVGRWWRPTWSAAAPSRRGQPWPPISGTLAAPGSTRRWSPTQGLVTSRGPDDLPAFCAKIVEECAEG